MTQPSFQTITPRLDVLKKTQKNDGEMNWVTAIFMGLFHVGAIAALFFFSWKAFAVAAVLWWIADQPGHRHGLSSPAHASRLQDSPLV